jgi:hypothetical protein
VRQRRQIGRKIREMKNVVLFFSEKLRELRVLEYANAAARVFGSILTLKIGMSKFTGVQIGKEEIDALEIGVGKQRPKKGSGCNLAPDDHVRFNRFYKCRQRSLGFHSSPERDRGGISPGGCG